MREHFQSCLLFITSLFRASWVYFKFLGGVKLYCSHSLILVQHKKGKQENCWKIVLYKPNWKTHIIMLDIIHVCYMYYLCLLILLLFLFLLGLALPWRLYSHNNETQWTGGVAGDYGTLHGQTSSNITIRWNRLRHCKCH